MLHVCYRLKSCVTRLEHVEINHCGVSHGSELIPWYHKYTMVPEIYHGTRNIPWYHKYRNHSNIRYWSIHLQSKQEY